MEEPIISEESKVLLQQRQNELIKLIEALAKLDESKEWNVLKELVFEKSLEAIQRQLLSESLSPKVNVEKIYRLQGEWSWAKQYCDLKRFTETLKLQLSDINKKIK